MIGDLSLLALSVVYGAVTTRRAVPALVTANDERLGVPQLARVWFLGFLWPLAVTWDLGASVARAVAHHVGRRG